ncbi:hypothetical protein sos41_28970 [Alphaproteobacteria bacterium SO-S41]|nr:hypothetical protein sos41_28970 [Alphaproteobacteria bacterium SO-S41]
MKTVARLTAALAALAFGAGLAFAADQLNGGKPEVPKPATYDEYCKNQCWYAYTQCHSSYPYSDCTTPYQQCVEGCGYSATGAEPKVTKPDDKPEGN